MYGRKEVLGSVAHSGTAAVGYTATLYSQHSYTWRDSATYKARLLNQLCSACNLKYLVCLCTCRDHPCHTGTRPQPVVCLFTWMDDVLQRQEYGPTALLCNTAQHKRCNTVQLRCSMTAPYGITAGPNHRYRTSWIRDGIVREVVTHDCSCSPQHS